MGTNKIIQPSDPITVIEDFTIIKNTFFDGGSEIEEIISKRPPFVVRWGTVFLFFLLLLIGLISWYINYPEIVVAKAKLSSVNAPQQVITRTDGKLIKITVSENEKVEKGQILGYIESIASPESVIRIKEQINLIDSLIRQNRADEIIKFPPKNYDQAFVDNLGDLRTPYQTFIQSLIKFRTFLSNGFFFREKSILLTEIQNIEKLQAIAINQKKLPQHDFLVQDKVISPLKYHNEKSKLIPKQLSLPQINAYMISTKSQQKDKKKEIVELENQVILEKNTFVQALETIKSEIQEWEFKYVLKAPVAGTVSFTGFFQENQEIKARETLFFVQPVNTSHFAEILVPQYGFGKVKQGQQVLLKFQAYPFEEYGSVVGKIDYLNYTLTDSGYLAKVILPDRLTTNYKKSLQYRNGLLAEADIIIGNMRLLNRFYYNIVKR